MSLWTTALETISDCLGSPYLTSTLAMTVPISLILLRTKGNYIGQHLTPDNEIESDKRVLALIAIVANLQDIFMIGSLWRLVLHVTGHESWRRLVLRECRDNRITKGWREECPQVSKIGQIALLTLAFLCSASILAVPTTNRLMSPAFDKYQDFVKLLELNGSADAQWPIHLTSQHLGGPQCDGLSGLYRMECVSGGLISLETHILSADRSNGGLEHTIMTPELGFPRIPTAIRRNVSNISSWSFTPHAATSLVGSYFWPEEHCDKRQPAGSLSVEVSSQAAGVSVLCTPDIQNFSNEAFVVSLPLPQEYDGQLPEDNQAYIDVILCKPLWGSSSESVTTTTTFTTAWIAPPSEYVAVTAGLVVLGPVDASNGLTRGGVVCSIHARWQEALHIFTATEGAVYVGLPDAGGSSDNPSIGIHNYVLPDENEFRHILADYEWLQGLTPIVPSLVSRPGSSDHTTALGNLLLAAGFDLESPSSQTEEVSIKDVEAILSTAIADAVSRVGLGQQYELIEKSISPSAENLNHPWSRVPSSEPLEEGSYRTSLTFTGYLTGYGFKPWQSTDYMFVVILSIYVGVTLWCLSYSISQKLALVTYRVPYVSQAFLDPCLQVGQPGIERTQCHSKYSQSSRQNPIYKIEQQSLRKEKYKRPALRPGLRRIEWTCECGDQLYGDFEIDQSVDALNASLHSSASEDSDPLASPSNNARPASSSGDNSSGGNTNGSTGDSQRKKKRSRGNHRDQPKIALTQLQDLRQAQHAIRAYLNLCVNVGEFQKSLGEVELTKCSTDGDMFKKIRDEYFSICGGLVKRILRRPADVHFVKFSLEDRYKVGILNTPRSLPPSEELSAKRYHYSDPLIPAHVFLHYFNSPFPHTKATWLRRLPQKLQTRITQSADELPIGWGIHIIEGTNRPFLFWFSFIVVAFSLVVSSIWAGVRKDIQGAFGIGAWIVAIPGVTTMAVHLRWGHD